jgi:DNA invertase Pin-like site-specific DNA recombinase
VPAIPAAVQPEPEQTPEEAGTDLTEADFRDLMYLGRDRTQAPKPEPTAEVEDAREMPRTLQVEEAIRLKEEGLSNRAIGKRFGVDGTTIGRWLKEAQARSNTDE